MKLSNSLLSLGRGGSLGFPVACSPVQLARPAVGQARLSRHEAAPRNEASRARNNDRMDWAILFPLGETKTDEDQRGKHQFQALPKIKCAHLDGRYLATLRDQHVFLGIQIHEGMMKSTVDEIRQRFDGDVERFSNLETGQSATIDAPLAMALVAQAAAAATSGARHLLDVGCGAGNYALKLLEHLSNLDVTLVDLSKPMLDKAHERVQRATKGNVKTVQGDIREIELPEASCDIIVAAAVLHHLRTDAEWREVFAAFHRALRPGGSMWVFDLVESSMPAVERLMHAKYGEYLTRFKDEAYRDHVFAYVEKEDTPRPLMFQLDLLRQVGFDQVEVLHKNICFAAFGAVKIS
jgi:tRNA (cmo5U34)-methyltransferase